MVFFKFQGTGNDFIIIDDRNNLFPVEHSDLIRSLCSRKMGIGADGMILLQKSDKAAFRMVYFNSDGKKSSMCGNGGRCIAAFADLLKIIPQTTSFDAIDGLHQVSVRQTKNNIWDVKLKMNDVEVIRDKKDYFFLDTGSPHHVTFTKQIHQLNVYNKGKEIRYSDQYKKEGTNVNFVEVLGLNRIYVRTYERGVENETLSCGTGVTASALCYAYQNNLDKGIIEIVTKGGELQVSFEKESEKSYQNIWLCGAAELIYKGKWIE